MAMKVAFLLVCAWLIVMLLQGAMGAKILLICLNRQGISHRMELLAVGDELAQHGHDVFVAQSQEDTPTPNNAPSTASATAGSAIAQSNNNATQKSSSANIVPSSIGVLTFRPVRHIPSVDEIDEMMINFHMTGAVMNWTLTAYMARIMKDECESALADEHFIRQARQHNFNMVIVGGFPYSPCVYLVPHHLGLPYISLGSSIYDPWLGGVPTLASFSYGVVQQSGDQMDFWQRLGNLLLQVLVRLIIKHDVTVMNCTDLLDKYSDGSVRSFNELIDRSLLFFVTRDHVLEWPMPALPNVIALPPLVYSPAKPLPSHFRKLVTSELATKHGVILVSFGSMANFLPRNVTDKMLAAFSRLSQSVIWKLGAKQVTDEMAAFGNIHIVQWFPQNDLLGHKNVKLFITHSGNNGQHEAVYHGVPMVTFPLQREQEHNAYRITSRNIGVQLDIRNFTSDQLHAAVTQVLTQPVFTQNVHKLSAILRDSPMTPRQTVAYWIEHVLKHGHQHLRSHAMDLAWYEYFMVDVIAFISVVVIVIVFVVLKVCRCCCNCVCKNKSKKKIE